MHPRTMWHHKTMHDQVQKQVVKMIDAEKME